MPDDSELDRIDPQPVGVKLSTGCALEVVRMQTRQFFRLLRVLTHGAGPALTQTQLNFQGDPDEFGTKLLMLVVMAISDAEQETDANKELWDRFGTELHNPALEDTLDLIEVIVRQEAPELQALGKKLKRMFDLYKKTGQDKTPPDPEPPVQDLSSPAPSRRRSTRSATSTDGPTSTSSDSPSAG